MENMESILRRVQKLLAIANDARANPNEAAAAGEQAEKMMRKFQLEHADVIKAEMKRNPQATMETAYVFANMKRDDPKRPPSVKNPPWGQYLAVGIAKLTDTGARQGFAENKFGQSVAALKFQGYGPDVQLAAWMFDYLVGATIQGCQQFNAERKKAGDPSKIASESYRKGFISTLIHRINEQIKAKQAEVSSNSTALVVAKQQAIAEFFGEFEYQTKRDKSNIDPTAYRSGREAAKTVDMNRRGISGGATSGQLRLT